jgi:UDP-N-acetylmuramoyl-tripeptide--D-alanyl-D-alanine ligase
MKAFSPNEIRLAVHGRWLSQGADITVDGVTIDSRTAHPGDLFVAIKGENFDGHDYLLAAAKAGCISAIVDRDADLSPDILSIYGGGLIGVEDTTVALGELAGFYRKQLAANVIAITGSNGKTTVKRMIEHILSKRNAGTVSPKSFNNAIGVPLTLLSAKATDDYIICEVGTNAPGEVLALGRIVQPDVAVITGVGAAHLEGLKSVERVAVEKASLLASLSTTGIAIVRGGQPPLDNAMVSFDCRKIRFGEEDPCELRITAHEPQPDGQRFQINERQWVSLPVPGRHNAFNALAAIAVAQRFGFEQEVAAEALADVSLPAMRLERIEAGEVTIINDAYNANPDSVSAAATVLAEMPAQRRVMILGDMRELGEQSEVIHTELGELLARRRADLLIGVGELGRLIARGAANGGVETREYDSVDDLIGDLDGLFQAGDVILVKGSRTMGMERAVEPIREAFA